MDNLSAVETAQTETEPNEVERAKAHLESLKQRMIAGEDISQSEFSEARNAVEFSELRQSARLEREKKQYETARRESLLSLQKRLSEIPKAESFDKLLSDVPKLLEKYLLKMKSRNDEISDIHQKLIDGGYIIGHINFAPVEGISVEAPTVNSPLIIGDVEAKTFEPREKVEKFVGEILQKYFPCYGR